MRTVVIAGGTRGIGGGLAERLRAAGDEVIALGSADGDLTSVAETAALADRLPARIDALVMAAGRFTPRRVVTAEGLEQTFAIGVVSRYLLAERLRPNLGRAPDPRIINLCGTGGIRAGRLHWDDLQLTRGYSLFTATMQGARANDLLGLAFTERDPDSRIRYVLYNPLFVDSGMHRYLGQPARAVVGAAVRLFGSSVDQAVDRLAPVLDADHPRSLTALRRGEPVAADFDRADAERLYAVLAALVAERTAGS